MVKYITLFCAMLMTSCAVQNQTKNMESIQECWELLSLNGTEFNGNETVYIEFTDNGEISGYSGCNRLTGSYEISGNTLNLNQLANTRMACESKQMNLENDFVSSLEKTMTYNINGEKLILKDKQNKTLATFIKMGKENIVNKYWKLTELDGKKISMSDEQEREAYFIMERDGSVKGNTGCNQFNGKYSLSKGMQVKFSDMAVSLRACSDLDYNETDFLDVFSTANNYTITNDELSLNIGKRAPLAKFRAVYFD